MMVILLGANRFLMVAIEQIRCLHLEPGTKVGPIIEIGLASLTRRKTIKGPVDIL